MRCAHRATHRPSRTSRTRDGFALSFTHDYSSAKNKNDQVQATEKFLSDKMGRLNVSEFMVKDNQANDAMKHKTSTPYLSHQNATAERNCCTPFNRDGYQYLVT